MYVAVFKNGREKELFATTTASGGASVQLWRGGRTSRINAALLPQAAATIGWRGCRTIQRDQGTGESGVPGEGGCWGKERGEWGVGSGEWGVGGGDGGWGGGERCGRGEREAEGGGFVRRCVRPSQSIDLRATCCVHPGDTPASTRNIRAACDPIEPSGRSERQTDGSHGRPSASPWRRAADDRAADRASERAGAHPCPQRRSLRDPAPHLGMYVPTRPAYVLRRRRTLSPRAGIASRRMTPSCDPPSPDVAPRVCRAGMCSLAQLQPMCVFLGLGKVQVRM